MLSRAQVFWRYFYISLITSLKLAGIVVVFLVARYWWGLPIAVIMSLAALTTVVFTFTTSVLALRVRAGTLGNQRAIEIIRRVFICQLVVAFGLLMASLVLRLIWVSAAFATWAMILLILLRKWRRAAPTSSQVSAEARGPAACPQFVWVFVAAIPVYLTLAVMTFILRVMEFRTLFVLTAIVSAILGVFLVVCILRRSDSRGSR